MVFNVRRSEAHHFYEKFFAAHQACDYWHFLVHFTFKSTYLIKADATLQENYTAFVVKLGKMTRLEAH